MNPFSTRLRSKQATSFSLHPATTLHQCSLKLVSLLMCSLLGFVSCSEDSNPSGVDRPVETNCTDGIDNDEDGDTDCRDSDCPQDASCEDAASDEICDDETDNDGDGLVDCDDIDCEADDICKEPSNEREVCTDGVDNDEDGDVDCDDVDCQNDDACRDPQPAPEPSMVLENCEEVCAAIVACPALVEACSSQDLTTAQDDCNRACQDEEARAMVLSLEGLACEDFEAQTLVGLQDNDLCTPVDPVEICDDETDNDGDGSTDCDDEDCQDALACAPTDEVCDDEEGIDEDGDGNANCSDDDCVDDPACVVADEVCDDVEGTDEDGDGNANCDDPDCIEDPACAEQIERLCTDGEDNDGDGNTDCDDPNCIDDPACFVLAPEVCDDGIDNDDNGNVDCDDVVCNEDPACADQVELLCADGEDNDGDGNFDCDDSNCANDPACIAVEEVCDDLESADEDGDGSANCDDTDCEGHPACPELVEICDDAEGVDEDGNGAANCADEVCADALACLPEIDCNDTLDNDLDGNTDCEDMDCVADPACLPESICNDDLDDDRDGLVDCADSDCADDVTCNPETNCDNGLDDDGDANIDCNDTDCVDDAACNPEAVCDDALDNDSDGLVDCADTDCVDDAACQEVCDDGLDNNGDGLVDCADATCAQSSLCIPKTCTVPQRLPNQGSFPHSLESQDNLHEGTCQTNDGPEDVWVFTVPRDDSLFCIDTNGSDIDTVLYVREGDCIEGNELACNDNISGENHNAQVEFNATANANYYVFVDSVGEVSGHYELNVRTGSCGDGPPDELFCADGLDNNDNNDIDCADESCARDIVCLVPPLSIASRGNSIEVTGAFYNTSPVWDRPNQNCTAGDGNDHFYRSVAIRNDTDTEQLITIIGNWRDQDGFLHLYSNPLNVADLGRCLTGNDDFNGTEQSRIENVLIPAGTTFHIVVSSFRAETNIGAFTLDILTQEIPAEEMDCTDGLDNDFDGHVDCGDADCVETPVCLPETDCADGVDNDSDGNTDCNDTDCGDSPVCVGQMEALCGNGIDEDNDGLTDCSDPNCARDIDCVALPVDIAEPGNTVELTGAFYGTSQTWNRPDEGCFFPSDDFYFYRAVAIENSTGVAQRVTVTATWFGGDGFLHFYTRPLNLLDPIFGCLLGDDDFNATNQSQLPNLIIPAGEVRYILASTFGPLQNIGAFSLNIATHDVP